MKKKLIFFCALLIFSYLYAQNNKNLNTVVELETEQKISERVEKMLFPFVGESVVIIDLDLKYPTGQFYGSQEDKKHYYKDDIRKSSSEILKNKLSNTGSDQIQITNMKVDIYLMKTIEDNTKKFVENSVANWLKLDLGKGDKLNVFKTLSPKSEIIGSKDDAALKQSQMITQPAIEEQKEGAENIWLIIVISLIISVILIALIVTLRSRLDSLRDSFNQPKETSSGTKLSIKSDRTPQGGKDKTSMLQESNRNPLRVNILKEDEIKTKDLPDFSFLEKLSTEEFFDLIESEKLQKNELSFIVSALSFNYVNQLLIDDSDMNVRNLIGSMIDETSLLKDEVIQLKEKILVKYKQKLKEQAVKTDGTKLLITFINNLESKKSKSVYEHISKANSEVAEKIKDDIFLFEDIIKLEESQLKEIIYEIEHDMMIAFLACVDDDLRNKFIYNMSERTATMVEEDLNYSSELNKEEKEKVIDEIFFLIKSILDYI